MQLWTGMATRSLGLAPVVRLGAAQGDVVEDQERASAKAVTTLQGFTIKPLACCLILLELTLLNGPKW